MTISKGIQATGKGSSPGSSPAATTGTGPKPAPTDTQSNTTAPTSRRVIPKTPEKSILDDVRIARARVAIESQPKQLHSLLAETTLDILSKSEHINSKRTGTLKLQSDETITPRSICFKAELDFPEKFKDDPATIENKSKFDTTMKTFQSTLRNLIIEQNYRTIALLSEERLHLFVEKMQAIAHGLTCYQGNLDEVELAGLSFEAIAAAVLHCYYSDLQPDDKLWQYLSTTKEKLMAEHTHQNLVTIDGQQILPAEFLELELNRYFCPWEYSETSPSSTDSEMALQPDTTETDPYLEDIETPIPPQQQQPPTPKLDIIFERLMVSVARKLTTLVPAMFMETASAMDEHKRKKRAENQTASVVKKTATVNMGNEIAQALAEEPPVSRATMASLIDERIKQHEKQSAKNIAAEARKKSSGGGGTKASPANNTPNTHGQKRSGSSNEATFWKKPRRNFQPPWQHQSLPPQNINPYQQHANSFRPPNYQPFPHQTPPPFPYTPWTPPQSFRGRGRVRGRGPQQGNGRGRGFRGGSNNA
jgi:hypothetical protein